MYADIINKIIKNNSLYNKEEIIKLSSKMILNQFKYDLIIRIIISLLFNITYIFIVIYTQYYPLLCLLTFSINIINLLYIKYKKLDELDNSYNWYSLLKLYYLILSIGSTLHIIIIIFNFNIILNTKFISVGNISIPIFSFFSSLFSDLISNIIPYFYYKNRIIQHVSNYINDKYYS